MKCPHKKGTYPFEYMSWKHQASFPQIWCEHSSNDGGREPKIYHALIQDTFQEAVAVHWELTLLKRHTDFKKPRESYFCNTHQP